MEKVLLFIGAVLVTIVTRSDASVELRSSNGRFAQARNIRIDCFVRGEEFVAWVTPVKPARPGVPAIPSKQITPTQADDRKSIEKDGDNYKLLIKNLNADDGGSYQCLGASNSSTFTLFVDINLGSTVKQNVRLGQKDTVILDVSSYPPPKYTWSKDGQALTFDDSRRTLDQYTGNVVLNPVMESDEGNYSCIVEYNSQQQPHDFPVIVVDPPKISRHQGDPVYRHVTVGYNITFRCDISSGKPEPTIKWYFSWVGTSQEVNPVYDPRWSHPTKEEFTITGIEAKEKEQYRCVAENVAGTDELRFKITQVDVAPMIDPMSDLMPVEGENVMLQCKVSGSPLPQVAWYKNGQRHADRQYMDGGKIVAEISFTNIQWFDGGMYRCKASNGAVDGNNQEIQVEETVAINVISPPRLISPPDNVYTFIGNWKNTSILCAFSGYPVPMVKMLNDNGTVVAEGNGSALFVIQGTHTDEFFGEYNCSAVNANGTANALLSLLVATKPKVPREVVVETTCKDISLTWQKPVNDGGMPITNYVISLLSSSNQILHQMSEDASLREAKISYAMIEADTAYQVSVSARNEVGYGDNKTVPAQTKKYCVPGKPQITNTEKEIESTFTLKWSPPSYDGGDNKIMYKVVWGKRPITDKTDLSMEENFPETYRKIENLENEVEFEFRVMAKNQAGAGEPDIRFFFVKKSSTDKPTEDPGQTPSRKPASRTASASPNLVSVKSPTSFLEFSSGESTNLTSTTANMPDVEKLEGMKPAAIAGIVIAVILIVLITIDLLCCFFNSCGFLFCCHQALCVRASSKKKDLYNVKATEMEKKPLPENV